LHAWNRRAIPKDRRAMLFPRIQLLRDATHLLHRLQVTPGDAENPGYERMLQERQEAADVIGRLMEESCTLRDEKRVLSEKGVAAQQALPLLRFAHPLGATLEEMRTAVAGQRLAGQGDAVLAWVNEDDLGRMQMAHQAQDHGDYRQRLAIHDDDPHLGYLITYDEAHNDPPPELEAGVQSWLESEQPTTVVDWDDASVVVLDFESPVELDAFRARWSRAAIGN
jgi:hypothetical protein